MDRQIQALTARVEKLERELAKNSRNSSRPPSSDPPGNAPAKRSKGRSGRRQGGQPGHEGKGRDLLPTVAVDEVVEHWPEACGCGHVFATEELVGVREPARHQVEELPRITTVVTEHRCQRVRCPECGLSGPANCPARSPRVRSGPAAGGGRGVGGPQPRFQARHGRADGRAVRRPHLDRECRGDPDPHGRRAPAAAQRARRGDAARWAAEHGRDGLAAKGQRRTLWGAFTEKLAVYRIARTAMKTAPANCWAPAAGS